MFIKRSVMAISTFATAVALSGCIHQVVTAPVQVAGQGAQTTGQTAGQAAQVVTPGDSSSLAAKPGFQANAYSSQSKASASSTDSGTASVKKTQRNNP